MPSTRPGSRSSPPTSRSVASCAALRLSSRPPKAGAPLPAELATKLTEQAGAALTADAAPERWVAVLDALAFSPVRDKVIPTSLPTGDLHADVQATIARLATRVPKLAHIFEIAPDPTAPRPERRRPPKPKKPKPEGPKADEPKPDDAAEVEAPTVEARSLPRSRRPPSRTRGAGRSGRVEPVPTGAGPSRWTSLLPDPAE